MIGTVYVLGCWFSYYSCAIRLIPGKMNYCSCFVLVSFGEKVKFALGLFLSIAKSEVHLVLFSN